MIGRAGGYVPAGEALLRVMRPSPWFIATVPRGWVVLGALASAAWGGWGWWAEGWAAGERAAGSAAVGLLALGLACNAVLWWTRGYVLTQRRLIVVSGLIRQVAGDVPLIRVQHVTVSRSLLEQLLGLGTVGFATAGSDGPVMRWLMVRDPKGVMSAVRSAIAEAERGGAGETHVRAAAAEKAAATPGGGAAGGTLGGVAGVGRSGARLPVIGLAGGIGSGKSRVARELEKLGCLVADSDALAREALRRADVRDELVKWWGEKILGTDGGVDRRAVANIVFADASQRHRLEGLVHPIIEAQRRKMRQRAQAGEARPVAMVIDAPLLFEAGVDRECDAVIFVDAPLQVRLARVSRTRGWDQEELARRETAQWPLERKRAGSTAVVVNDGEESRLGERVRGALEAILASVGIHER